MKGIGMKHADVLAVLADPTRLRILELLGQRRYCTGVLADILGISAPAVSQHMKVLQGIGLVYGERAGCHTHYAVNRELLRAVSEELLQLAEAVPETCDYQHTRCGEGGRHKCARRCMDPCRIMNP